MFGQSKSWSKKDIPNLEGKIAVVTGGNGGLGYEVSLGLAEAGATVIIAARNEEKGNEAIQRIKAISKDANVSFSKCDLSSLESVKTFAETFNKTGEGRLDILVNNAGVMLPPTRTLTPDGFELQFATNHLSHFALTSRLLPSLKKSSNPRFVNVSAIAAKHGKINFDDLQYEKTPMGWGTYGQTKLANLLFTFEFQRRSEQGEWGVAAIAAHPGVCRTDIVENGPGKSSFFGFMHRLGARIMLPAADSGALPILYAAASPEAKPGGYYGPQGIFEYRGAVGDAAIPELAQDKEIAEKLWDVSNKLSGVTWP